jgi:hypothetical protein
MPVTHAFATGGFVLGNNTLKSEPLRQEYSCLNGAIETSVLLI